MSPAEAAKVFIDGSEDDYLTSSILAADCKFAEFEVTSFLVPRPFSIIIYLIAKTIHHSSGRLGCVRLG